MKRWTIYLLMLCVVAITGCSHHQAAAESKIKIGIMLSESGLGDQSFNDSAFYGLEKARDELGILFDYKELADTGDYKTGFEELIAQGYDLIIGHGPLAEEDLRIVAEEYPEQQFAIVDSNIDLPNVLNINFKEQEASFLAGALAGMKTNTDIVGFIGGETSPVTQQLFSGFRQGVAATNPEAEVLERSAGTSSDEDLGAKLAFELVVEGADYIFPPAGTTGKGVIQRAQESGGYTFGLNSDQFYLGEETVVSSAMKKIDVALFSIAKDLVDNGELTIDELELGLKENGVGLAPIRVIAMTKTEEERLNELKNNIINESILVNE
ncbi:BMP family ABC transporter substrate-binding protein [Gracilibacillus oryzae]|uniref:BMP family ABC transporter substrate-binding protein n=1 Tax=Gracilibacillus oryzae TaxID=1672701 RepID=A0A7C8GV81_9BACI|nr:BMP family ABC transporter substrate-binding protein [Gracilibacillus oryzae]KAB8138604.1 BMP family ABC transporter substrate-binding protein [Gracilibacillus oryzae]